MIQKIPISCQKFHYRPKMSNFIPCACQKYSKTCPDYQIVRGKNAKNTNRNSTPPSEGIFGQQLLFDTLFLKTHRAPSKGICCFPKTRNTVLLRPNLYVALGRISVASEVIQTAEISCRLRCINTISTLLFVWALR